MRPESQLVSFGQDAAGVLERTFALECDHLTLGFTLPMNGELVTRRLLWRRFQD
jgi:hypothetical protein